MKSLICMALLMQLACIGVFAEDDLVEEEKSCDKAKCPSVPKHYEEMGCEAVKNEGDCCASR